VQATPRCIFGGCCGNSADRRGSSWSVTLVNEGFDAASYQPWCGMWRYGPMPLVRWIGRLSLVLTASTGGVFTDPARSTDIPVKTDHSTEAGRPRLCTDLNGKTFRWHWPNVPFAAVCSDDEGRETKPPPPAQEPAPQALPPAPLSRPD
jgi:hypothetical protein